MTIEVHYRLILFSIINGIESLELPIFQFWMTTSEEPRDHFILTLIEMT